MPLGRIGNKNTNERELNGTCTVKKKDPCNSLNHKAGNAWEYPRWAESRTRFREDLKLLRACLVTAKIVGIHLYPSFAYDKNKCRDDAGDSATT